MVGLFRRLMPLWRTWRLRIMGPYFKAGTATRWGKETIYEKVPA